MNENNSVEVLCVVERRYYLRINGVIINVPERKAEQVSAEAHTEITEVRSSELQEVKRKQYTLDSYKE